MVQLSMFIQVTQEQDLSSGGAPLFFLFSKDYLFEGWGQRAHKCVFWWGGAESEGKEGGDSMLSGEPEAGMDPKNLRS